MPLKISLKQPLFIASIAGIIFSSAVILSLIFDLPVQSSNAKPAAPSPSAVLGEQQAGLGLPVRLLIPKINVNAAIESVGLTPDGAVGVPKSYANTAWFNVGVKPGEVGSAIISGHYGWVRGRPVVFNNLAKLRKGDKVYSKDKTGAMVTFVVRELRSYSPDDVAMDVFVANDGKAHLNLITCEGVWNKVTKNYSQRLVVFTDKE